MFENAYIKPPSLVNFSTYLAVLWHELCRVTPKLYLGVYEK